MKTRLTNRIGAAALVVALGATACTDAVDTGGPGLDPDNPTDTSTGRTDTTDLSSDEIVLTSGLQTVDTCDALLSRIKDEAIERVGPYGFDTGHYRFFEGDVAFDGDDAMEEAAADTTTSGQLASADGEANRSAGSEFSETNNQEQGVDEADLVKTDGRRLVVASGNELRVIDVTGDTPRLTKTIDLPEDSWGGQLFLEGDRALLMTSGWTERPFVERSLTTDWYPGSAIGRLMEIDLDAGAITRTFEFEGYYLSAREIDGTIRIVLTANTDRFAFVYPSNEGANESAELANRNLIEGSTIDQWIPTYRITQGGETVEQGPIVDCDRVHLPADFAGFGSLITLTADLADGLTITDSVSIFTDAQTVYASPDRLAVATPRWPEAGFDGEAIVADDDYSTAIHTFDITDAGRADYVASGTVRGHLLNQFSLSEHDGYLRVATTDGSPWGGEGNTSESFVTVLAEDGNALHQIGQVGGLGRGEQIFAVRFIGDVGYVVTFEQIDPLYTVDLSDPTDPRVLGELKIPGFSSYLHPIDDDHLVGVGTDGDERGFTSGAVISLFDVSDLTNPTRTAQLNFDRIPDGTEGDSYSPVSHDAKAFTYWDGTAIVPVSWWGYDPVAQTEQNGAEVVLVDVDVDGALTEVGRVSHPSTTECESGIYYEEELEAEDAEDAEASFVEQEEPASEDRIAPSPEEYCYTYAPQINRSVIVGDDLFTVSDAGVLVTDYQSLDDVTWISFRR